jgi:predicted component of type VI protein secretion system
MNVRLLLKRNRKCIWSAQLSHTEALLGRARGCNVRIPSSEVSRQHCRLRIENNVVTVEDLESVNGTFINGTRVRDIETVQPGDRLTLGPVTFVVEYDSATQTWQPQEDLDDLPIVELESPVEVIEDTGAQPKRKTVPMVEPVVELEPVTEPAAELEEAVDEISILDDPDSEIHLPQSGDDLRDFLIELEDSSERPDLR